MGKTPATQAALPGVGKTVRLFHWKPEEAAVLVEQMTKAGYRVYYPGQREPSPYARIREMAPVAVVIDQSRMPSWGRYVAAEIRSYKGLRQIPIVFVDGSEDSVARTRRVLPDATYTTRQKLLTVLRSVKPLADPVTPPPMGNDRPVALKLGMKPGLQVGVVDAPAGYVKLLGTLPEGVELVEEPDDALPLMLWFVRDPQEYQAGLRRMRRWLDKGRVWVMYPKGNKTPLTQFTVREGALAMGMVDYKVCSVDATWTGLLFTLKK